jgi:spore coat protein U-like protein
MPRRASLTLQRQLIFACVACMLAARTEAQLQSCSVSATAVNFGTYNPLSGTPNDATGTVTTSCQVLLAGLFASWTVALSTGSSGTYAGRQMNNAPGVLTYNLYTNAARTSIWGDGSAGTTLVSDNVFLIVGSNTVNYTLYGRLFAGQDQAAGSYSDTITVTLTY